MINFCNNAIEALDNSINELGEERYNSLKLCEIAINLILAKQVEIKEFILKKGFKNEREEIQFFKEIKPKILSKLIYYNSIYKIETKKPHGRDKTIRKYLNDELAKLKRYFDNNLEFYKYYRTNSTYLDHKYFVRGKYDIKLNLDTYYFETDHNFSTSHDYKVAKIIANDLIQLNLEDQISKLRDPKADNNSELYKQRLIWTGSKTALTELVYALHAQGVFDNGNADIKLIAKTVERAFNIDLGDFYHTFMELKSRKINQTKFIDSLRDALIRRMDEEDEV